MKTVFSVGFAVLMVSTLVAGDPIEQKIGEVAVTKVESLMANTIVAMSFKDFDGSALDVSKLVKTGNLSEGDILRVYNGTANTSYRLKSDGTWEEAVLVGLDANGGPASNGDLPTPAVGTGIWVIRENPEGDIILYGKPADGTTSAVTGKAWNLIGNPTQEAVNFADLTSAKVKDAKAQVPKAGGGFTVYTCVWIDDGTYWSHEEWGEEVQTPFGPYKEKKIVKDETITIAGGTGLWYYMPNDGTGAVNWNENEVE